MLLFCQCSYCETSDRMKGDELVDYLRNSGLAYTIIPDLCKLVAEGDPRLHEWADDDSLTCIACFPRAVRNLFGRGGALLPDSADLINWRIMSVDEVISLLNEKALPEGQSIEMSEEDTSWVPWFPVIDKQRCIECKLCYNFCLFGVYSLDEDGKVQVSNPSGCKTNCPACARVCPQTAIIFPKHPEAPVNGDDLTVDNANTGPVAVDLKEMLSDKNLYDIIRARTKGRRPFATKRDIQEDVTFLHRHLDIPVEVLNNLKPDEIQRLRKKAQARAAGEADG